MTTAPDTLRTVDLDDRISAHPQGWEREVTVDVSTGGPITGAHHKIRATVYRDSYDFQSRLYVDVWSPAALDWHRVQTLSGREHGNLPSSSLLRRDADPHAKEKIRTATQPVIDAMLAYAILVLS